MFNLSESEDNPSGPSAATNASGKMRKTGHEDKLAKPQAAKEGEEAEDWEKTRASKRVSLASVDLSEGEMRKLSLKKREREVTARYIGPDTAKSS